MTKTSSKICLTNIFLIWIIIGVFTSDINAAPKKKKILGLLEGRHWSLKSNIFYRLGEGTDSVLIKIASDTKIINYIRFRALEALALFPSERTANFLEKTIKKSFAPLARRGFESFVRAFRKLNQKKSKDLPLEVKEEQLLLKQKRKEILVTERCCV